MTKTPKRLKTSDALGMFRAVLKESGFNPKEPDLKTGWEAFRRFAGLSFECADDSLLFEAGIRVVPRLCPRPFVGRGFSYVIEKSKINKKRR